MERFIPGADFGRPYTHVVLVCINPQVRSFDKCSVADGTAVLEACRNQVQALNLGHNTFVATSGCILGCQPHGAMVTLVSQKPLTPEGHHTVFLRNVTVADVASMLTTYLLR